MADEFYIGYESVVPPGVGVRARRVVALIVGAVLACAIVALAVHSRLSPSRFDFGRPRTVEGWLTRTPYPTLQVDGRAVGLVGAGKHGADAALAGVPDGLVRLRGAVIARGGLEMLEVNPESVEPHPGAEGHAHASPAGHAPAGGPALGEEVTLTGEIVDSKCFLGVMNPGEGTVHRDCARLCLRGGIPPMLLVRGDDGDESLVLLVSSNGGAIGTALASFAGQSVTVRGRLTTGGRTPTPRTTSSSVEPARH